MLLYQYDVTCPRSRMFYVFMNLNNVEFEACEVKTYEGELRSDPDAAKNALKFLPKIVDDEFEVTGVVAIFQYLLATKDIDVHWYASTAKSKACIDECLEWQQHQIHWRGNIFWQKQFIYSVSENTPIGIEKNGQSEINVCRILNVMEEHWMKMDSYMFGVQMSFADLIFFFEVQQAAVGGCDVFDQRPKLRKWYQKMLEDIKPETDGVSEPFMKVVKDLAPFLESKV